MRNDGAGSSLAAARSGRGSDRAKPTRKPADFRHKRARMDWNPGEDHQPKKWILSGFLAFQKTGRGCLKTNKKVEENTTSTTTKLPTTFLRKVSRAAGSNALSKVGYLKNDLKIAKAHQPIHRYKIEKASIIHQSSSSLRDPQPHGFMRTKRVNTCLPIELLARPAEDSRALAPPALTAVSNHNR